MKISNASKKVLASALSAAMVVAFAPAAALGQTISNPASPVQTAQTVKVTYDINGGTIDKASGMSALANEDAPVYTADGKTYIKVSGNANDALQLNTSVSSKNGVAASEWFVDEDNDGVLDSDEYGVLYNATPADAKLFLEVAEGTTEVTLKAHYATASISSGSVFTAAGITASDRPTLGAFGVKGLTTNSYYTASLTDPSGNVIASSGVHQAKNDQAESADAWTALGYDAEKVDSSYKFAKGDYTFAITEVGKSTPTVTKTFTLVELTFDAGKYGSFASDFTATRLINKEGKLSADQLASTGIINGKLTTDTGYNFSGWEANGKSVSETTAFKKDTTLTAVYDNPQVSAVDFGAATTFKADGKGTLKVTAEHLVTEGFAAADAEGVHYQVTVSGPNGFTKVISKTADNHKLVSTDISSLELAFGEAYEGYQATTSKLEAGTYTVSVEAVADEGYALTEAQKTAVASKSVALAAVSYDMAGAEWKDAATAKAATENQPTLAVEGTSVYSIKGAATGQLTYGLANDKLKFAGELQQIDYITINGVKADKITAASGEKVSADGVKVAVVTKESKATLPEVSFEASGDKYVATVVPAAGTTVKVNGKALASDGKIALAANATLEIAVTAGTKSNSAKYFGCENGTNAVSTVGSWATDVANATTSVSTKNAPVRYGATLTTLKADAVAAVKAIGFAKGADWDKAWGKTVLAQKKAVLEKAAAVELGNIEAAKALVKGADGKYSYVSAAEADKAIAAVNKVVADFEGTNAVHAGDLKSYIATSKYDNTNVVAYNTTASNYAAALKIAATCATVKVEASVAEPVIAVTDAFAKLPAEVTAANAKEAKAAAEAAIKAYGELNEAQKKLVSSADYDKAVQTIKAADEAVANADKAAVSKVKGKTVKAKAKKATKASLKVVTSKSGAKSTFKKTSGNSKVTVSKTGKITVKKGLKAGKTYTVKVKATVGTQTKTVKVVVKVAK